MSTTSVAHTASDFAPQQAPEPVTLRCAFCGGPFHPASGCVYGVRLFSCASCTRECWEWVRSHTLRKT
jgi:hypothetical protein